MIILSIVGASIPMAQAFGPQFGLAAGVGVPTGAYHSDPSGYGKGFNTGWQGLALAAFRVSAWPVGFRVDGTYGVNNANTTLNDSNDQFSVERSKVLGANLDLLLLLPPTRLAPYLIGGVGVYHTTISIIGGRYGPGDTSETTHAWNVGAGILYRTRGLHLFFEARYVNVSGGLGFICPLPTSCPRQHGPRTTFVPIMAGIQLGKP